MQSIFRNKDRLRLFMGCNKSCEHHNRTLNSEIEKESVRERENACHFEYAERPMNNKQFGAVYVYSRACIKFIIVRILLH